MTITAIDIINRALSKLGVKRAGVELTEEEINDSIDELNDMMLEIDATGVKLGYTIVSDKTDVITAPDWAYGAIRSNLAVRMAHDFDIAITPALAQQAEASWEAVLQRVVEVGPVQFPDIMPIGSGNEYWNYERFFKDTYRNDLRTGSGGTLTDEENINIQED